MSLGHILQHINDRVNYDPKLRAYKNHVLDLVNQHYMLICGEGPWRFLQRSVDFNVYADITGSASSQMEVLISSSEPRQLNQTGPTSTFFGEHMEGAVFHGFYQSPSTAADDSFRIARVNDGTNTAFLDKNWPYSGTATQYWRIEFRDYYLPEDCAEVLGFNDVEGERGRLVALDRRRVEREFLARRDVGDPSFWFESDKAFLDPPIEAPTLSQSAGGGLKTGRIYRYFYTYVRLGMESSPSPHSEIKLTGSNATVSVSSLEDTRVAPTPGAGISARAGTRKRIYRRDVTGDGPWLHIATIEDSATSHTDNVTYSSALYESRQDVRIHVDSEGRKKVTFWWTPSSTKTLDLRYLVRPTRLQYKAQKSHLPNGYEKIIEDYVLSDILSRTGDKVGARLHHQKALELHDRLRNKELNLPDRQHRMSRFDAETPGEDNGWNRLFGTPSIT